MLSLRLNYMKYVNYIHEHDHKLKWHATSTKAPDTKPITAASSPTKKQSLFETKIDLDTLSFIQRFLTLSDTLSLINVNHFFNNFFKMESYLITFRQWQEITIDHINARKLSQKRMKDWSRYKFLSKLNFLLPFYELGLARVFEELPTNNLFFYRGHYFMPQRFDALRVAIFEYDNTHSDTFYDFGDGWFRLEVSKKKLQLFVINNNKERVYRWYGKSEIIMFNNSYCHIDSMEKAVHYSDTDIIIYQNCELETTSSRSPYRKHYEIRPRTVIFIDMYAWYSLWAVCTKGLIFYRAGFTKLMYKGEWEQVVQKGKLPNIFWETIISSAHEHCVEQKSISGTILFTITGAAGKDTLESGKTMVKKMFQEIEYALDVIGNRLQLWKELVIGIGSIEDATNAFVFDLVKIVSAPQIEHIKMQWLDVLDGISQVHSHRFWQQWDKIKETAKM